MWIAVSEGGDHRPLLGIFKGSNLAAVDNPRLQRILMKTAGYTFNIEWIPGKNHRIADTLSRYPLFEEDNAQDDDSLAEPSSSIFLSAIQMESSSDAALRSIAAQAQSHPAKMLTKQWDSLSLDPDTGLLVLQGHRILLPNQSRPNILRDLHQSHQGIRRTRDLARSLYFWPGMNNDIEQVISSCAQCQEFRPSQSPEPLIQSTALRPFEAVSVDLFHSAGVHYLIMVDRFSGWPCVARLSRLDTGAIIRLLEDWFVDYGIPQRLRSDGGPQFRGDFAEFCRRTHIDHELSSAYHPASNGHAESAVKAMKTLIQKHGNDWRAFRQALLAWRNVPRTDGLSPAQWLFGRGLRTRIPGHPAYYNRLCDQAWSQALIRRGEEREKVKDRFDTHATKLKPLQPHDTVLVQDPRSKKWNRSGLIICARKDGRSYDVEIDGRSSIRNRKHLRPITMERCSSDPSGDPDLSDRSILRRSPRSRQKTVRFKF